MAYTKTSWTNDSGNAISAINLNKMEKGIADAHDPAQVKSLYEDNLDTNAFTDEEKALLAEHEDRLTVVEGKVPFIPFYDFSVIDAIVVTSDTYATVNELTTAILPAGTYELKNTMVSNYDVNTRSGFCRISFDGGTNWLEYNYEPKDATDIHVNTCGRPMVLATDAVISIVVQARCESNADTMTILTGNLILERKL